MRDYDKYERKRKEEIVNRCLSTFMKNGLVDTTTKNMCDDLHMNSGAVFYYFKGKDEIVVACAEEAKRRIEEDLFGIALDDLERPERLAKDLHDRAISMSPLMKFFVSVCTTPRYEKAVHPLLNNLGNQYKYYIDQFAEKLDCTPEEVAPYVYIVINTMLSYMLFGKENFVAPQLELVYDTLVSILEKNKQKEQKRA